MVVTNASDMWSQLEKLYQDQIPSVKEAFVTDGTCKPYLFALLHNSNFMFVVFDMKLGLGEAETQTFTWAARFLHKHEAVGYVFITDVWMTDAVSGERREALLVEMGDREGTTSQVVHWYLRDPAGRVVWADVTRHSAPSRFSEIFVAEGGED